MCSSDLHDRSYYRKELCKTLNDAWLFDDPGLLSKFMHNIRGDVYALLDDGWDIPYIDENGNKDHEQIGSCIPNPERFPYGDTPAERLRIISDKVKELGYAGLGLWIPHQAHFEKKDDILPLDKFYDYWAERARWFAYADVKYVKVDWGHHNSHGREYFYESRKTMTRAFRDFCPDVTVEHYVISGQFFKPLPGERRDIAKKIHNIADVCRLYDISPSFNTVTTLNRVAEMMSLVGDDSTCLFCAGEDPYIAATLGMTMGMMSHPFISQTTLFLRPDQFKDGIYDTKVLRSDFYDYTWYERALYWQRICPPVPFGETENKTSDTTLTDTWFYNREPYPYNASKVMGRLLEQSAPAAIARNTELPIAEGGEHLPYLTAFQHPTEKAYAIGMLQRTVDGVMNCTVPPARVKAFPMDTENTIGIFGPCEYIDLVFDKDVREMKVFLCGMLDEEAEDVTDSVTFPEFNTVRISGELLSAKGLAGQFPFDHSEPACVMKLV